MLDSYGMMPGMSDLEWRQHVIAILSSKAMARIRLVEAAALVFATPRPSTELVETHRKALAEYRAANRAVKTLGV